MEHAARPAGENAHASLKHLQFTLVSGVWAHSEREMECSPPGRRKRADELKSTQFTLVSAVMAHNARPAKTRRRQRGGEEGARKGGGSMGEGGKTGSGRWILEETTRIESNLF
jgi:hypothetical protein